ncbi:MAG: glycosyltransferase family 4 protein [Burkholderiales bacterium]
MLGPSEEARGGVSSVIRVYGECGLFADHPVRFLATTCGGPASRKLRCGLQALADFVRALMKGSVAAVHAHVSIGASVWRKGLFALLGMAFRIPVILHLHAGEFVHRYGLHAHPLRARLVRWLLDHATTIVVLSPRWLSSIRTLARNTEITVLPNPVQQQSRPPSIRADNGCPTLVYLGRFSRNKGIYDLLEIHARLVAGHAHLRLVCAGDGEVDLVRLRVQAASMQSAVEIREWISPSEKWALLNNATVYVLPSYFEGLPMSLLEAMAVGVPVVASRVGGIPDLIVDRINGLLVEPGDVDGFVAAIDQLLGDSDRRRVIGMAGRRTVEANHSGHSVVEQLRHLYARLDLLDPV